MNTGTSLTLFATIFVLALMPSASGMIVAARSAASGFLHGVMATLGIAAGDIIFIMFAVLGLAMLAETLGSLFVMVEYLGGAYLLVLGFMLMRPRPAVVPGEAGSEATLLSSFLAGLSITLADQKAILFYFGFFPAFVDLSELSVPDVSMIVGITIVALGSAKLVYAWLAVRVGRVFFNVAGVASVLNRLAGLIVMGVGLYVVLTAG
jgi:threonine/homoserine/homoserine lactone efflux protein